MQITLRSLTRAHWLLSLILVATAASHAGADSAEVLPKGVWRADAGSKFYFPIDKRFNDSGNVEDVATDFNASLNSNVFQSLRLVEAGFGLPPGSASLGNSVVSFEYNVTQLEFALQYGVTNRLTLGVSVPYWWLRNNVKARLDTSTATVGKSAALNTVAPLGFLDTQPFTTEDVQALLGRGLDINGDGNIDVPGFGFKRFASWSDDGFADIEAGFRYQYLKTESWRLAFTGGARFPTGKVDDPDNLTDLAFGDGTYAALFRLNNDYTGIKDLVLNLTLRYDLVLPDKQVKRVPDDVNQPITANKENVSRDLGDIFEVEFGASYNILPGLTASGIYKFGYKLSDDISGRRGFAYKSLEEETSYTEHIGFVGLSYSTFGLYAAKVFPVPLIASLAYRNRFAGTNVLKSQYIALSVSLFF